MKIMILFLSRAARQLVCLAINLIKNYASALNGLHSFPPSIKAVRLQNAPEPDGMLLLVGEQALIIASKNPFDANARRQDGLPSAS